MHPPLNDEREVLKPPAGRSVYCPNCEKAFEVQQSADTEKQVPDEQQTDERMQRTISQKPPKIKYERGAVLCLSLTKKAEGNQCPPLTNRTDNPVFRN